MIGGAEVPPKFYFSINMGSFQVAYLSTSLK
jgi:hypothetical protein